MFLDYFALGLVVFVSIFIFYGIIVIHDIPYEIAVHRNHPHQDAIHVAGWISLFTLHTIWPFLWIWSTLYRDDRGWGFKNTEKQTSDLDKRVEELSKTGQALQSELAENKGGNVQNEQQFTGQES